MFFLFDQAIGPYKPLKIKHKSIWELINQKFVCRSDNFIIHFISFYWLIFEILIQTLFNCALIIQYIKLKNEIWFETNSGISLTIYVKFLANDTSKDISDDWWLVILSVRLYVAKIQLVFGNFVPVAVSLRLGFLGDFVSIFRIFINRFFLRNIYVFKLLMKHIENQWHKFRLILLTPIRIKLV